MAVNLSPVGGVAAQFFNNDGTVLSGGKLNTYTAGTTTPAVTYTTSAGTIAHGNPIQLNSAGRVPGSGEVWLTDGITYKFVLTDANDVLIATYDNISGINSNFINFTNQQEIQTATSGQTIFTLTTMQYQPATGSLSVFVDGVNQYGPGAQYAFTETSATVVTFVTGLHVGASVKFTTSAINAASYGNAFQISYTPPFTGSVATNVGDKLAQTVSVMDFGATGNGTTDDTAAIQAALTAANCVFIPSGTYKITASLNVPSNTKIYGAGASSIIQLAANSIIGFANNTAVSNIIIRDLQINGGGQTSNIYTGYYGNMGIRMYGLTNAVFENLIITKMGCVYQSNPQTDGTYGGFGIQLNSDEGIVNNVNINNCTVSYIAGGGNFRGDGIDLIGGYNVSRGTVQMDVVVTNCNVTYCGRHCYTVEGDPAICLPSGLKFIACFASNSALCGLDIESGDNVFVDDCTFKSCGNDQTYYNPAVAYGATYRLLAAIAIDNDSSNIYIDNTNFNACYYGFTYGASQNVTISNCVFQNGTYEDIKQGLATGVLNFKITNCSFKTALDALQYYRETVNSELYVSGCLFAGRVLMVTVIGAIFDGCTFKRGIEFSGGSGASSLNTITNSVFEDFLGDAAITVTNTNSNFANFVITNNLFRGTGNLVDGIRFKFLSALNWIVSNNKFVGLTAGINIQNGGNSNYCDVTGNNFEYCIYGILVEQSIRQSIFANNSFGNTINWCIRIAGITSADPMPNGPSIMNNVARTGCLNGVSIALTTGSYDYTMLVGNNVHACTGTKWSLAAGNANGIVANNITT